jgi:hypothetical protein
LRFAVWIVEEEVAWVVAVCSSAVVDMLAVFCQTALGQVVIVEWDAFEVMGVKRDVLYVTECRLRNVEEYGIA